MQGPMENQFDVSHWIGHIVSLFALTGSMFGLLPAIAGVAALAWYVIQIWESRTVQEWAQRRNHRKILQYAAKLAALQLKTEAHQARITLKAEAVVAANVLKDVAKYDVGSIIASKATTTPTSTPER